MYQHAVPFCCKLALQLLENLYLPEEGYLNDTGPTDGIVQEEDGMVYCLQGDGFDGVTEYQVVKVRCSGKCIIQRVERSGHALQARVRFKLNALRQK